MRSIHIWFQTSGPHYESGDDVYWRCEVYAAIGVVQAPVLLGAANASTENEARIDAYEKAKEFAGSLMTSLLDAKP